MGKGSDKECGQMSLTRRSFLSTAAAAGAAAITGFPSIVRSAPAALTFPNSGGALEAAFKPAYYETFKAATGIDIIGAPWMEAARIKAMVENNAVDVDVIGADPAEAAAMAKLGLLEPLDYDIIDKSNLGPGYAHEYFVLTDVAALAMSWNTSSFNSETRPKSWAEFFDSAGKPGTRSLWKSASQTLDIAALGGGQDPAKLYPLDLDKAFATLDKVKKDLVWWTSGAQSAQLLIDGEVDLGSVWNGRIYKPIKDGAKIDYTYDQCLYTSDCMIVPKGSPHKKEAMEFIANMVKAENQAIFSRNIPYGPTNPKAFDLLDEATKKLLPNSPSNGKTAVTQDYTYWAENGPQILDRFNKWLVG